MLRPSGRGNLGGNKTLIEVLDYSQTVEWSMKSLIERRNIPLDL